MTAPRSSRRWLRFSLRGAFVVLTILCVWLALEADRVRRQERAVKIVQSLGGSLFFDYQVDSKGAIDNKAQAPTPAWLRRVTNEEWFRRVESIGFGERWALRFKTQTSLVHDDDLALLRDLPDLTTLELSNNPAITDEGLTHCAGLHKLRILYLHLTGIRGPGIRHLPRNLEGLSMGHTPCTDEGLQHLSGMAHLKTLQLENTRITDRGIRSLPDLPALEVLVLSHTDITDAALKRIEQFRGLKQLSINGTNVTAEGITKLEQALPQCAIFPSPDRLNAVPTDVQLWPEGQQPSQSVLLETIKRLGGAVRTDGTRPGKPIVSLSFWNSPISDASLSRLIANLPDLEELKFRHCLVGDGVAEVLPNLKGLSGLYMEDTRLTDIGLAHIAKIPTLRRLEVGASRITDHGLPALGASKQLISLTVNDTRVTYEGLFKLQQVLPTCQMSK